MTLSGSSTRQSLVALFTSTLIVLALLAGISASTAAAQDYCVGAHPLCPVETHPFTRAGLNSALLDASTGGDPAGDRVFVGTGTIDFDTDVASNVGVGHAVEIIGTGPTTTIFNQLASNATTAMLGLNFEDEPTSSIKGIGFKIEESGNDNIALSMTGGTASNLRFELSQEEPGPSGQLAGIYAQEHVTVEDSTFVLDGNGTSATRGITTIEPLTVRRSAFIGTGENDFAVGISFFHDTADNEALTIEDSSFTGLSNPITGGGGTVTVLDSLIDLGSMTGITGIQSEIFSGAIDEHSVSLHGTTIVGSGAFQIGVLSGVGASGANTMLLEINVSDTLIDLSGASVADIYCTAAGVNAEGDLDVRDSMLRQVSGATSCDDGFFSNLDPVTTPPVYVNAAAGDYRPHWQSLVIDAGFESATRPVGDTDLGGKPRIVDGNRDGAARIDIGAYEYQEQPPTTPTISSAPAAGIAGEPVTLAASASEEKGGPITYQWSFGDGTTGTGAQVAHTFAAPGSYTVGVTATTVSNVSSSAATTILVAAKPKAVVKVGKPTGSFKVVGKRGKAFALGTSRSKPRIQVKSTLDVSAKLTLAKVKAGYASGKKCVAKKPKKGKRKRCDLALKGSQTVKLKAGTSYLTFGGKFARKKLARGKYKLTATPADGGKAGTTTLTVRR